VVEGLREVSATDCGIFEFPVWNQSSPHKENIKH
jgi:hypothetical protein